MNYSACQLRVRAIRLQATHLENRIQTDKELTALMKKITGLLQQAEHLTAQRAFEQQEHTDG